MSPNKAIKLLSLIKGFFLLQSSAYPQPLGQRTFVQYEDVMADLQSSDSPRGLQFAYDYCAVLLLDSSKIELVLQTGFQDVEEFRAYAIGLSQAGRAVGCATGQKDIKALFQDQSSLEQILDCIHGIERADMELTSFESPIYVKGNEAVFTTSGPTGSDTYFARLEGGVFHIRWLGGVVE